MRRYSPWNSSQTKESDWPDGGAIISKFTLQLILNHIVCQNSLNLVVQDKLNHISHAHFCQISHSLFLILICVHNVNYKKQWCLLANRWGMASLFTDIPSLPEVLGVSRKLIASPWCKQIMYNLPEIRPSQRERHFSMSMEKEKRKRALGREIRAACVTECEWSPVIGRSYWQLTNRVAV